jgi:hypothetical protein
MRSVPLVSLCVALVVAALAGPAAAAPPPPIPGVAKPTPIAVWQGRQVWSVPNATGGYGLVQRIGSGPVTALPVAPRGVPFDVDLGPTSSGGVYAVYSRCATEPRWDEGVPSYETGKGCDVYRLDLATGSEVRFTKVNATDGSEYWPTYWKGSIGFARAYDSKPTQPYVYVKDVASSKPSLRMPGGGRGIGQSTPLDLELYGSRLAFGWMYLPSEADRVKYEMRVDTVGGGDIVLDSSYGGLTSIVLGWPSFENGKVWWVRACLGDPGGCPAQIRFEYSRYSSPPAISSPFVAGSPPYVLSHERDSGVTYALTDANSTYGCTTVPATTPQCTLQALTPSFSVLE